MGVSNWMGVLPSSVAILLAKALLSEGDGLFVLVIVMVTVVVCLFFLLVECGCHILVNYVG